MSSSEHKTGTAVPSLDASNCEGQSPVRGLSEKSGGCKKGLDLGTRPKSLVVKIGNRNYVIRLC